MEIEYRYEREDIAEALKVVERGGLIIYPTDTIWGIGCDATNAEAVARVFELKRRVSAKALISIVDSTAKLPGLMRQVPEIAYDLIEATTTPLTIIYPEVKGLAHNLLAEDGSAGIRVVSSEPFCRDLCQRLKRPLVSTSANISGEAAPAHFGEITEEVLSGVDYVVKYRQEDRRPASPSSIIKLEADATFKLIR